MWLGKTTAGATSTGHTWASDGAVVEVPDEHAAELLAIADADFYPAAAPATAPEEPVSVPGPVRRRRKPVTED